MLLTSPLSSPLKNPVRDVFSPAGGAPLSLTAQVQALFAAGKQGSIYSVADFSKLWQDAGRTVAVTSVGQSVLCIDDQSGNGNHMILSSALVLSEDTSGFRYLQGDGIASGATASNVNLSTTDKVSYAVAYIAATTPALDQTVMSFGNIASLAGSFDIETYNLKKPLLYWRGSTGFCAKYLGTDYTAKLVFSSEIDLSGVSQATETPVFRVNGVDRAASTINTDSGSGNFGSYPLKLFAGYGAKFAGRFYGAVLITGLLSGADMTKLEAYLGSISGVSVTAPAPLANQLVPTTFTDSLAATNRTDYYETSAYGRLVFDTTATTIDVVSWSNITALFPTLDDIGMYIDGVYYTTISHGGNGGQTTRLALAGGSKRITLVNGAQSQLAPIRGTFVVSVGADAAMTQIFPATANRIAIYGDSIAVGANANNASQQSAWAMQLRAYRGTDSTVVEAQGFRSLYDDAVDATARAAFVAKIVALAPAKLWMAIGTNDYGIPKQSAANFGTKYAAVLDDLHTALPSLVIYCQTPTVRTSEVANSYGDTLGAYRTQISTAVSTRGAYATLVDGTTLIAVGDLADDVHPSTAGHGVYYTAVKTALGI